MALVNTGDMRAGDVRILPFGQLFHIERHEYLFPPNVEGYLDYRRNKPSDDDLSGNYNSEFAIEVIG